jgi:cell division control protein 6
MTHAPLLRHDQTLFRDPEVFEPTYLPGHLHHRDAQIRELAFLISPALRGASPMNAILRGPPGTGKTTTVRRVFAAIAEETRRLLPAYVNCRHNRTPAAVYRCTFEELFGYAPPPTGRHLDDIKRGIVARLQEEDAALIVCLDDANYLVQEQFNTLLYQVLRLYERWDVRKAGVFAVSSDLALDLYAAVDGPVRSVFHPVEVNFWPYGKAEIREILDDRVRQGLYPRVMPATLLDRIAGIAAREQDIRVGIDLLRIAVTRAEKDGRRQANPGDVAAAARAVRSPVLEARVAGLSAGERALLCQIAERSREGVDMASAAVFEATRDYLPIAKSTYHEHLNRLAKTGIVDLVPGTGRGRGRGRAVCLRYDPEDVAAVCRRPD